MAELVFEEMKNTLSNGKTYDYVILDLLRYSYDEDEKKYWKKIVQVKQILNYYHYNLDKVENIKYSYLDEDGAAIEYPWQELEKKISNVKHLSEDDTVIFFGRFNMLKYKENKNGEKIITTFYEDYGYIPIGVHIKEKDKFYYMPKNPDEFFIGNGKELYTGCIDFTFTEYSSAIIQKFKNM